MERGGRQRDFSAIHEFLPTTSFNKVLTAFLLLSWGGAFSLGFGVRTSPHIVKIDF